MSGNLSWTDRKCLSLAFLIITLMKATSSLLACKSGSTKLNAKSLASKKMLFYRMLLTLNEPFNGDLPTSSQGLGTHPAATVRHRPRLAAEVEVPVGAGAA